MTIYDIAQEAGVSASTVSRVINNKKGINSETRQKILRIMEKYHFEPNASAQGLVSQSSKLIGIIMSDIRTLHHSESAYYLEQALQKAGYSCLIVNCGFSDESREISIRNLASRRPEAVVLIGSTFQSEHIGKCIRRYFNKLPVILENGLIDLPNVYSVLADEENGVKSCVSLLVKKGRKHICCVNVNETPSNQLKLKGFSSAYREYGLPGEPMVVSLPYDGSTDEWFTGYRTTQKLMTEHPEIDAVIYSTDYIANAGIRAMEDMGIRVPKQVSVVGIDNSVFSKISSPRMTVLDNKMQELSLNCSNVLLRLLNGETPSRKLMVLSDIIEREST